MSTTDTDFNPAACGTCGDLYDGNMDADCAPEVVGVCVPCAMRIFVAAQLPEGMDPDSVFVGVMNSAGVVMCKKPDEEETALSEELAKATLSNSQTAFQAGFAFGLQYHGGKRATDIDGLKPVNEKARGYCDRQFIGLLARVMGHGVLYRRGT